MAIEFATTAAANRSPALHPLIERLCAETGGQMLDQASFDAWARAPGRALVVFTEDPVLYRETLDIAVIVPELALAFPGQFRTGVLPQGPARAIAARYGFKRWPAVVMLLDGQYVGAIDGLRDWQEYIDSMRQLLAAHATRPPSIGIAVAAADAGDHHCH